MTVTLALNASAAEDVNQVLCRLAALEIGPGKADAMSIRYLYDPANFPPRTSNN